MPKYWIITVTEENWQAIKTANVYGAPESRLSRSARNLIKPGDIIIFYYVKKNGSKNLEGKFVGAFRAALDWYREEKPLWLDETREGRAKYPWRIRLELIKLGIADFKSLVPRLEFIKRKERPNAYLVGTPANLRRPIPEHDAKEIIDALS
ncbi:MAG: EVE domain-containing protein [Desulfurococcales archaeon]|nr:EVE domain-containing protein [Desulfurococcales archaeon]